MKNGLLRASLVAALVSGAAQAEAQDYRRGGPPAVYREGPRRPYAAPRYDQAPVYRSQPRYDRFGPQPRSGYGPPRGIWTAPGQPGGYARPPWYDGRQPGGADFGGGSNSQ